ncbi:hypothetical protein BC835DRAFT_1418629 [Cytidiella melzeri]|nr:hypothetical protein BC835DRAFT_1418629 [Cytidiella melzeri]
MSPLSITTNILRLPKLPLGTSNKAAPTVQVSLSNANAQRELASIPSPDPHSCIPFPSQPIQCARISSSHTAQSLDGFDTWLVVDSPSSVPETSNTGRHLPLSFVHRALHGHSLADPFCLSMNAHDYGTSALTPPRKRKMAVKRVKVPTQSVKNPKRTKRSRSSSKHSADLQFTATLHRSILAHLRNVQFASSLSLDSAHAADYDSHSSMLHRQDQILVERLWKNLMDRGLAPIPFRLRSESAEMYDLSPERVDHVFQTEPIALGNLDDCAMNVDHTFEALERIVAPSASPAPQNPVDSDGAKVLALSQLVASLMLRHRDRSSTRSRSRSGNCVRQRPGRSPLSSVVKVTTLRGRK